MKMKKKKGRQENYANSSCVQQYRTQRTATQRRSRQRRKKSGLSRRTVSPRERGHGSGKPTPSYLSIPTATRGKKEDSSKLIHCSFRAALEIGSERGQSTGPRSQSRQHEGLESRRELQTVCKIIKEWRRSI